jgi:tRNA isopentenyl-2-thiomethyl-A-37 hydroxylase MiaE
LTDHAWCEQKAFDAISLITQNSENLVTELMVIARELEHLQMVRLDKSKDLP